MINIFDIPSVSAEQLGQVTKLIDGEKEYLGNGMYKASLKSSPIRIVDTFGNIVDSEIIQNSTHVSVNSVHGKFLVDKNTCVLNMLNDDESVRTTETYDLYRQKNTENPVTGTWVKDLTNNFACELQDIISNSTGVYIPFKKTETVSAIPTGNELNITFKKEEGKAPKWDASYKLGERAGQKYDQKFMWGWKTILADATEKVEVIDSIFTTDDGLSIKEKDDGGSLKASATKFEITKTQIDSAVSADISLDKKIKYIKNDSVYKHDFTPAIDLFQDVSVQIEDGKLVTFARYVDLTVPQKGDVITIDPTFTSNNPTVDGDVRGGVSTGTSCNETVQGQTTNGANILVIYPDSDALDQCYRAFIEFGISTIDDDAEILSANLILDIASVQAVTTNCDIIAMSVQPSVGADQDIFDNIRTGTVVADNNVSCASVGDNKDISLGSGGVTYVTNQLTSDWVAFGVKPDTSTRSSTGNTGFNIVAEEGTGTPDPTLEVVYSTESPPSAPLNPVIYTNDTSQVLFDWDTPTDCLNCGGFTVWNASNNSIINNSTDSSVTFLQLSGLTSGKNQTLFVSAWNATGTGTNSTTIWNFTKNTAPILDDVNVINSTAFELFYSINGTYNGIQVDIDEFPYSTFATFLSNSTSSAISFIINGTGVAIDTAIKIFAHNIGGTSLESNQIINATSTPEVPVLTSSAQTSSTVTLVMASNNTGSSYNISKSPSGCGSLTSLVNSTSTPYIATDLSAETQYCFQAFSVNAYGNSTGSTLLNVTTSAVGAPPITGGGGGSGAISGTTTPISNALLLNLNSKTLQLSLGEKRTYSLELIWDETKEFSLLVKNIKLGQGQFDSLSIIPESLPELGKKIIAGKGEVLFTLDVPSDQCGSTQVTARCVNLKTYTIPVMVSVEDVIGTSYPDIQGVLTVTISEKFPIGLAVIIVLLMSFMYPIYKIIRLNSKTPRSPKNLKKNRDKILEKSKKIDHKKAKHNQNILKRIKKGF